MKNDFLGKSKKCFPYALLISIIVLPWFLKPGYLFLTDMSWGPSMKLPNFTRSGFFYFHFLAKILSFVFPADMVQKLFLTAILSVILFGGYTIAKNFSEDKIILFLGSAFVLFNPFVYDRLMYGQVGMVLGYGFFLAAFGYLISFYLAPLEKKQLFLAGIFSGLSILSGLHFIFFIGLVYSVFGILISLKKWPPKDLLKVGKYFLLSVLIIGAINLNWLLGIVIGSSKMEHSVKEIITEQDLEAFKTVGETKSEVIENVFLMSGFWGMEQFRYANLKSIKENWGRSFYLLLPIIVWGPVVDFRNHEKRKLKISLLVIYVIAFVLALGTALPITSKITLWFFNNILFYQGLREPQKWVAVMVIVYEILLVCGLIELFKKKIMIENKELIVVLLTFVIMLQAPLMVWGGAGQIRPINYPQDWYEVNDFIVQNQKSNLKDQKCDGRILFLPWHLYMSFKWIGNIVANPSAKFFRCSVIHGKNMEFGGIYSQSLDPADRGVEEWLFSSGETNFLQKNELDIGFIVLAKEVDWQNYLWIGNHPNVEFVKETENLRLYRVVKYGQE